MKTINLLISGGLALIVIGLGLQLSDIRTAPSASQYYSPSTIPVVFIASTLALFAVIFIRDAIRANPDSEETRRQKLHELVLPRRMIFLVLSVIYVLSFPYAGFVVASLVYLTLTAFLLGTGRPKELVIGAAVAVVLVAFIYGVVSYGLQSFLPDFFGTGL